MEKIFKLEQLLRDNIKKLKPYSSARNEYSGVEGVFLDANENSQGSTVSPSFNRYPDPLQWKLKERIAVIKKIEKTMIFLGNGSDEPIDLVFRAFCRPGIDNVIVLPPTYGMYEVSAAINDVEIKEVPLNEDFQINADAVLATADENTKALFICSPNNPTGNTIYQEDIIKILDHFEGLVVVDEAYIDFSPDKSFLPYLNKFPNLIVLQTFSKAWGMAGLRLGMAFASDEIIQVFNKIKFPYNLSQATQLFALEGLKNLLKKEEMVEKLLTERERLKEEFLKIPVVKKVFPSDANFLLVRMEDGNQVYEYLVNKKIITRNRSNVLLCENCLRITVGTEQENNQLLEALRKYPE